MNRLIIVGNGFDLALGLPSTYEDFLVWYFNKKVIPKLNYRYRFSDDLWTFSIQGLHDIKNFTKETLKEDY